MSILILNGSPSGKKGNGNVLVKKLINKLSHPAIVVHLCEIKWTKANKKKLFNQLEASKGFIFVTGTYWDSWGSPLQIFLESVTELEGGSAFLGKPVAVFVLNQSVGGKGVLSRLQGVLSTLGCLVPPMSGMVYSWVNDQVFKQGSTSVAQKDLWSLNDIADILVNFQKALKINIQWESWPVDKKDYRKIWL